VKRSEPIETSAELIDVRIMTSRAEPFRVEILEDEKPLRARAPMADETRHTTSIIAPRRKAKIERELDVVRSALARVRDVISRALRWARELDDHTSRACTREINARELAITTPQRLKGRDVFDA
jgi:hypothetical protein